MTLRPIASRVSMSLMILLLVFGQISIAVAASKKSKAPYEAEVIYLTDQSVAPQTIVRSAGKFMLVVKNLSSVQEISIAVQDQHGKSDHPGIVAVERTQDFLLDLGPGSYIISEASNKKWNVTLSIK